MKQRGDREHDGATRFSRKSVSPSFPISLSRANFAGLGAMRLIRGTRLVSGLLRLYSTYILYVHTFIYRSINALSISGQRAKQLAGIWASFSFYFPLLVSDRLTRISIRSWGLFISKKKMKKIFSIHKLIAAMSPNLMAEEFTIHGPCGAQKGQIEIEEK